MSIAPAPRPTPVTIETVTVDLYRDIHKGIRAELFALVGTAGRIDPADAVGHVALADHVRATVQLLAEYAEHEDAHCQPAIEAALPALAERIAADHAAIEARFDGLVALADDLGGDEATRRGRAQRCYVELAAFTGDYLAHQDVEERLVMPALEEAIGPEATLAIHQAIVSSIPPEEMGRSLAVMLPAMNVDDRAELLGGMQAGAPPEVFEGVWSLAGSVLDPDDHAALARRLGR